MKKYIVTEKHPLLKEGLIITLKENVHLQGTYQCKIYEKGTSFDANIFLSVNWIKEIEEKEFTKSDMLSFKRDIQYSHHPDYEVLFNAWIKKNKTP